MSRFGAGILTTAGSTTLPIFSLYGAANVHPRIRELGLFNTSNTAVALRLVRLTTTGTRGTTVTPVQLQAFDPSAAVSVAYGTHTVAPTISADLGYRCVLGAAAGSGMVWTWDDFEFTIASAANAGIGVVVENGTGQAVQAYVKFTE